MLLVSGNTLGFKIKPGYEPPHIDIRSNYEISPWEVSQVPGYTLVKHDFTADPSFRGQMIAFATETGDVYLDVCVVPSNLTSYVGYVLDGFDQAQHDLLFQYNKFYKLEIYFSGIDYLERRVILSDIVSIATPPQAPYYFDVMINGKLMTGEDGGGNAGSYLPKGVNNEGMYIRARYQDPDKVDYGRFYVQAQLICGSVIDLPVVVVR